MRLAFDNSKQLCLHFSEQDKFFTKKQGSLDVSSPIHPYVSHFYGVIVSGNPSKIFKRVIKGKKNLFFFFISIVLFNAGRPIPRKRNSGNVNRQ